MSSYGVPKALQSYVNEKSIIVRSPGRINLIGEHTDYNNGFVLPAAIDKAVYVVVEKRKDDFLQLHSVDFRETVDIALPDVSPRPGHWSTYILGVADQFRQRGVALGGFNLAIDGDVPLGAGLSSSAAVECAVAFALNELFGPDFSRMELALMAQAAEHQYAGVKCGIMDQFASLFGKKDHVIRLDCRSLEYEYFPLELKDHVVVLFDTQVKHSLASSEYNVRRAQCEEGVALIRRLHPEVQSLRDATQSMVNACIDEADPVYPRCKFVVEEIGRVQKACADLMAGDLPAFGREMFATHEGLSRDYAVSCAELDHLVNAVRTHPAVLGARMMGGGFGGCTINLIHRDAVETLVQKVGESYQNEMGKEMKHYIVNIENGTGLIQH